MPNLAPSKHPWSPPPKYRWLTDLQKDVIVHMSNVEMMSQTAIAAALGVSQASVSRTLRDNSDLYG